MEPYCPTDSLHHERPLDFGQWLRISGVTQLRNGFSISTVFVVCRNESSWKPHRADASSSPTQSILCFPRPDPRPSVDPEDLTQVLCCIPAVQSRNDLCARRGISSQIEGSTWDLVSSVTEKTKYSSVEIIRAGDDAMYDILVDSTICLIPLITPMSKLQAV
ncbi:uncharacterized protein BT62DRAFT_98726 [Guyanagaster necrorhizus]|uniref:Uncharacterized protein n=1 Tax=Guyanagaster necrorhizus TaxID=856835 RepID=A0A9P7VVP8_9AGAR|nr:uncharacterized protein BT62DRAFT_98726 [Guyanagaster necrorhizus MCA 3950]KAG7447029.1 hypothetical protein BT62DRAFT_98726 [Guyanagaster necrorhizus MCA 3950]